MNSTKQKITVAVAVAASIILTLFATGLPSEIKHDIVINRGVKLIRKGKYAEASEYFDELWDDNYDNKEALYLGYYAQYLQNKGKDIAKEKCYLDRISSVYDGALADEINAEKAVVYKKCQEYIDVQKEEFNKEPNKYREMLPFVGMNAQYIDKTYLGGHRFVVKSSRRKNDIAYDTYTYTYATVYGDLCLMTVTCTDYVTECVVTDVTKYNEHLLWNGDQPNLIASKYKDYDKYNKTSSSNHNNNNYYGYEYSDFEDFYYDNEEDFDSLDDAEDYYNEFYDDFE